MNYVFAFSSLSAQTAEPFISISGEQGYSPPPESYLLGMAGDVVEAGCDLSVHWGLCSECSSANTHQEVNSSVLPESGAQLMLQASVTWVLY